MQKSDILKDIFDKNIIEIIKIFAINPKQHFSLSQVAYLSGVKTATSLRIVNKLIEKNFVDINIIGKTKYYRWKNGLRADFLIKLLQSTSNEVLEV